MKTTPSKGILGRHLSSRSVTTRLLVSGVEMLALNWSLHLPWGSNRHASINVNTGGVHSVRVQFGCYMRSHRTKLGLRGTPQIGALL